MKIGLPFGPQRAFLFLLPIIGIGSFVLFYVVAALHYPGGSWVAPKQSGFSFWNNYLCDLLDIHSINGEPNTARFYAIVALCLLCASLFLLWFYLPRLFENKSTNQSIMRISGLLSLTTIVFLALGNHDKIVRMAGFFGVIAFISCIIELHRAGHTKLFLWGVICLLVFLTNYYIYETGSFIESLPVVQKITFILFIGWFVCLDVVLYRKVMLSIEKAT